ncbi:hypothetical protein [Tengunoibacter tsumagoiensis]|uniref:Uncharacterized protein n=1 Tax=Tengunoibacter tsumagoiensis TaxID=2014871 RepID=A0A401ZX48_9CHLR|nr:hypothetical protein [Tengunoibacter tsumagoiensis]GCE11394.1 hypothetical protein KTT_12530 [Tengunoibacter tsumagoiensis]
MEIPTALSQAIVVSTLSVFLLAWMITFTWLAVRKEPESRRQRDDAFAAPLALAPITAKRPAVVIVQSHRTKSPAPEMVLEQSIR